VSEPQVAQTVYEIVARNLADVPAEGKRWWIAYSGGLDSHVLLVVVNKLAASLKNPPAVHALHINHQLSPLAGDWVLHCRRECKALNIPLKVVNVRVVPEQVGPEAAARRARYRIFEQLLDEGDCLLQGHHLQDQSETILFRLFRGHGVAGLAGIPAQRQLGRGKLLRPMLTIKRLQLQRFANDQRLNWIEDESNFDQSFDRNYIRQTVLPVISGRWPKAIERIAVSARWQSEASQLMEDLARIDLDFLLDEDGSLNAGKFLQLSSMRRKNVLLYWLRSNQLTLSEGTTKTLLETIEKINERAVTIVLADDKVLSIHPSTLRLIDQKQLQQARRYLIWDGRGELITPLGGLALQKAYSERQGQKLLRIPSAQEVVSIRYRKGGESFRPLGRQGSCSLKKWFQENQIPVWQRYFIPLIYYDESLVAVADLALDERFATNEYGLQVVVNEKQGKKWQY